MSVKQIRPGVYRGLTKQQERKRQDDKTQMFQNRNEQLAAAPKRREQGMRTTTRRQATSSKSKAKTRAKTSSKSKANTRRKTSSTTTGHRDLNVAMSKFQRLLREVVTLQREIDDINMHVLDGIENPAYASIEFPPKSAALKLSDVRLLFQGKLTTLNVIEPQGYNSVTKLTMKNHMMQGEACDKFECGLFHTGRSGIAQSGDGGDGGDKWYLVNNAMFSYLQTKLAFMKQTRIGLSVM